MDQQTSPFWSVPTAQVLKDLQAAPGGLSAAEAASREGGLLGFWQERGAAGAGEKLLSLVEVKAQVLRNGAPHDVPLAGVVPSDVVVLSAGAAAPGTDGLCRDRMPTKSRRPRDSSMSSPSERK